MVADKKKARKFGLKLGFLDETGLSERPTVRRTWAPKGKTPVIRSTGSWKSRSVIGVILCTASGRAPKLFVRIFKDTITADKVIRFFKELRRHVKGKIILVWDRLPAHRAKKVQAFLDTQKHWLTVEWLPGYAPELNPVEYLWSAAKAKDWANLYVDTIGDVEVNIRKGARRFRRNPNLITSCLKASTLFDKELST